MLNACAARFDVMVNLEKFLVSGGNKQGLKGCLAWLLSPHKELLCFLLKTAFLERRLARFLRRSHTQSQKGTLLDKALVLGLV